MPKWRDIASAPKDGTRILAFGMAYAELAEKGDTWVIADDRKQCGQMVDRVAAAVWSEGMEVRVMSETGWL